MCQVNVGVDFQIKIGTFLQNKIVANKKISNCFIAFSINNSHNFKIK